MNDGSTNAALLIEMLESFGCRVHAVENIDAVVGQLCAAVEQGDPFRAAILDAQAGHGRSADAMRAINVNPRVKDVALLLLTAVGTPDDTAFTDGVECSGRVRKPIKQSELFDALVHAFCSAEEACAAVNSASSGEANGTDNRNRVRILVADDNAVNRRVAERMLTKASYSVVGVEDGRQALAALERGSFDLVLMDVQMPEMDGLAATAAIRKSEEVSADHIPIVAMTAHAMKGDRERCLAAGMDDYVAKPIDARKLLKTVEELAPHFSNVDCAAQRRPGLDGPKPAP